MWQYMKWEINQQGMADSVSIRSSKRAGLLVRRFYQVIKGVKEADPIWFWETLLKYRRIPPS